MRLYYRPKTSGRPMRVPWLLEELGIDYETVPVDTDSAEHRQRSPLGRVPVLEFDDGSMLFDSTAILFALADRHPASGIGAPGSRERDLTYQWALTAQTELEKGAIGVLMDKDDDAARELFDSVAKVLSDALEGREFLVGDSLGVADIVTVGVLFIAERSGLVTGSGLPALQAYFARVGARPALARAAERTESLLQPGELLPAA